MFLTYKSTKQANPTQINPKSIMEIYNTLDDITIPEQTGFTHHITFNMDPTKFTVDPQVIVNMRTSIASLAKELLDTIPIDSIPEQYETFYIPKKSGGQRRIDAPKPTLMALLDKAKNMFEYNLKVLSHDSAYAYVKSRSIVNAISVHQEANSNWFLKLDIKDFFPNHNAEYIFTQLTKLYPFFFICQDESSSENLKTIIHYCLLDGKLPQGTPMSPILTNLCMLEFDHLMNTKHKYFKQARLHYTRYADDLLISSELKFDWQELVRELQDTLSAISPFVFKATKTRFGSRAGRNWNLGLMLNKDNQITIGWKKKQEFRAGLDNLLRDKNWTISEVQQFQGLVSYYTSVEPDYFAFIISKYEKKHGVKLKTIFKTLLSY